MSISRRSLGGAARARVARRLLSAVLAVAILFSASPVVAQRGGGGVSIGGGGGLNSSGRPGGVDEKDELKTFHAAMKAQATSDQASAFRAIVKRTEAAAEELGIFEKKSDAVQAAHLKESLEKVRLQTKNFVDALSAQQKVALKETTARLEKTGADLSEQARTLDGTGAANPHDEGSRAGNVKQALDRFRNQQDRLALEMGIVFSDADVAFTIPAFKTSAELGGQRIAISSSTAITRAGIEDGRNNYKIVLTADLSDLAPNLTAALGATLNGGERCGERYSVDEATLGRSTGTGVTVTTKIYAERWTCSPSVGEREIAEGRGRADVKVTPVIGAGGELEIQTGMAAVDAKGFLADSLRGGPLDSRLQKMIARLLERAIGATDFKATLPAAAASLATMRTARFQSTEGGDLNLIVEGNMQMSEEQAKAFGDQLKERVGLQAGGPAAAAAH